jgi:hypothetical protein
MDQQLNPEVHPVDMVVLLVHLILDPWLVVVAVVLAVLADNLIHQETPMEVQV